MGVDQFLLLKSHHIIKYKNLHWMTTAGVVTWSGMETKSIVEPYGNNISVAFPLGMYTLNVGKVSVALAYTNIGVLSLLHKREQECFTSPEMHLKSRVSLTNCIM